MKSPLDYDLYIFDMGNVVIKDIATIAAIAEHYGFDYEQLLVDYHHYDFPLMDGTIPSSLYWQHVAHQFGITVTGDPLAEFFHPNWNEPVVEILEQLRRAGKRVVCGSNTYAPHWELLKQRGFLTVFDAAYASHELGFSKPSAQFFRAILDTEQVPVQRALFIDDYEENIIAAKAVGFDTIHYQFDEGISHYFASILT